MCYWVSCHVNCGNAWHLLGYLLFLCITFLSSLNSFYIMLLYCFTVLFTCPVNPKLGPVAPTIRSDPLFRNNCRPRPEESDTLCSAPSIRPDLRISIVLCFGPRMVKSNSRCQLSSEYSIRYSKAYSRTIKNDSHSPNRHLRTN